jgi:hypothetical protein
VSRLNGRHSRDVSLVVDSVALGHSFIRVFLFARINNKLHTQQLHTCKTAHRHAIGCNKSQIHYFTLRQECELYELPREFLHLLWIDVKQSNKWKVHIWNKQMYMYVGLYVRVCVYLYQSMRWIFSSAFIWLRSTECPKHTVWKSKHPVPAVRLFYTCNVWGYLANILQNTLDVWIREPKYHRKALFIKKKCNYLSRGGSCFRHRFNFNALRITLIYTHFLTNPICCISLKRYNVKLHRTFRVKNGGWQERQSQITLVEICGLVRYSANSVLKKDNFDKCFPAA